MIDALFSWPGDVVGVIAITIAAISWAEWKQRRVDRAERADLEARWQELRRIRDADYARQVKSL